MASSGLRAPSSEAQARSAIRSRSPQLSKHRIQEQYAMCSRISPRRPSRTATGNASTHCCDVQNSSIKLTVVQYLPQPGVSAVRFIWASKNSASRSASAVASTGTRCATAVHSEANCWSLLSSSLWMRSRAGASTPVRCARAARRLAACSARAVEEADRRSQFSSRSFCGREPAGPLTVPRHPRPRRHPWGAGGRPGGSCMHCQGLGTTGSRPSPLL
mmetsp:Transcript_15688/g.47044  ORF Transcript_15688/g.47044 Transcript_15688/m.47044 type:complete len:217 (-) Transcript_15688:147-797(-)